MTACRAALRTVTSGPGGLGDRGLWAVASGTAVPAAQAPPSGRMEWVVSSHG